MFNNIIMNKLIQFIILTIFIGIVDMFYFIIFNFLLMKYKTTIPSNP
jgi:bacteriorhodopsin